MQKFGLTQLLCFILLSAIAACDGSLEHVCCNLKANHKPDFRYSLRIPTPETLPSCKWVEYLPSTVAFTASKRLLVGGHYSCFDTSALYAPVSVSHSLDYVLLLDLNTGETLKTVEWHDESVSPYREFIQILPSPAGILVEAGKYLKLLDSNLDVLKTRSLPISDRLEHWKAFLSPTGAAGLLRHWGKLSDDSNFGEDHWFSPQNLEDTLVETGLPYGSMLVAIDEDAVYYNSAVKRTASEKMDSDTPIDVRHKGEDVGKSLCAECRGVAEKVLSGGTILIGQRGPRAAFILVHPSGEVIFRGRYGTPHDNITRVAQSGDRLVLNFDHFGGGMFNSRSVAAAVVLSVPDNKTVFELNVKRSRRTEGAGTDFVFPLCALSSDGNLLAALEGHLVYIFKLPVEDTDHLQASSNSDGNSKMRQ